MKRLFTLILFFSATLASFAQARNATVTGLATDPSGARVPGVRVTATNAQTNIAQYALTDEGGQYTLAELPPGNYKFMVYGSYTPNVGTTQPFYYSAPQVFVVNVTIQ